ncbi:MAG: FAD-dependent oxidoreductase [Clostridia bacterium]|nr:FAD-dependent oxidoreductase [Clostridia bacterium]
MKKILSLVLAAAMLLSCFAMPAFAEEADADVIVIGAGGGGLSAALEAVAQGAQKVLVLEMTAKTGGALNYTSGSMSAAGTIIQKEEGVQDSVEDYVADILRIGGDLGGKPNEELVRVYANEATATFDWLYEAGLKDNAYSVDRATGNRAVFAPEHALFTIQRTYKPSPDDKASYKSAAHEVLDALVAAEDKIEVKVNTKATELVANEKGQVLTVVTENGETYTAAKGIIMTTGGYSANGKLMAEFVPYGDFYLAGGAPGADGNGLLMMQKVGAGLVAMDAIPTFPMGLVSKDNPKTGAIANTYTWKAGGIVVNQNGERFCNETETNPAIREVALEGQPGAIQYDIFTDKIIEDLRAAGQAYFYDAYFAAEGQPGWHVVKTAATIEELAGEIGVPADKLAATVASYNAAVEGGASDEFGRLYDGTKNSYNVAVNKIEGEKFYAVPLQALCVMTLGGVTANENMQVLDEAGNAIPGLYAAGEVVGGVWGKFVSSGTGVMGPITFARIAARSAMNGELAEGYTVKASANLLDEQLFVKEKVAGAEFDMSAALADGEYTATVDGQEGPMTVKTVIAGGVIASVEIVENHETPTIAAAAMEQVPAAIVAGNTVEVDGVTGATMTSTRIMKAVAACLEQAAK